MTTEEDLRFTALVAACADGIAAAIAESRAFVEAVRMKGLLSADEENRAKEVIARESSELTALIGEQLRENFQKRLAELRKHFGGPTVQ
jgi:hypothetical protein